jgi:hypothetical protein
MYMDEAKYADISGDIPLNCSKYDKIRSFG